MLQVVTDIPFGNAGGVEVIQPCEGRPAEVRFTAHPHGGPEALWFCFRIVQTAPSADESRQPATVRLVLQHMTNMLGANRPEAIRPVVRPPGGDAWQRLPGGTPVVLDDGRVWATWTIPEPRDSLDVAFCYPYGPADLDRLVADSGGALRADAIGLSQAGRPLVRVANGFGEPDGRRPGVYLVARQHSGETPGSFVADGLLRRLAECGDRAPLVWAVPLANIDGVEQGDYGKDNFPYDLNRAWGPAPMRHEVLVIQADMRRWRGRCRAMVCLDLHGPGACETTGVYAWLPSPERTSTEHHARSAAWAAKLEAALEPEYICREPFGGVPGYVSRWNTPNFSTFCAELDCPGLCLETSYVMAGETVLTEDHYREIGRRLADCLVAESARF